MLKNQGGLSMAFVMEPEVFAELYQDQTAGEELRNLLETVKNSIFLLVSSLKCRRELSGIYREKRGLWRDLFPKI